MPIPDTYFKKQISYVHNGTTFTFDVAHTLFSSHEIDAGSELLLRTLDVSSPRSILDLGCGCGVLGIVLAHQFAAAHVTLADKDLLAVRYARHNCAINGVDQAQVLGSVGCDDIPPGPYDLIVSNIPAKIGDEAIEHEFIRAPLKFLHPDGVFWFVVVSGLNHLIPKIGTRNNLKLKSVKKRTGYTVYRLVQ